MVLCKFFQQGSCRFGSKCVNEHVDVKQMIKTDVEAAVNGKQWPLSTYGPFRDKPSIPNFIEDQSFEEVRMLCYESKQKNFFDQFHQQFNKEALEATNKMRVLLQMTPNIVDVLINVYDTPSDTSSNGVAVGKAANNPFGLANSGDTKVGSIFAKSTAVSTSNNIFASSNGTFPTTGQVPSGIFQNSTGFAPQQQQQTSMFGQVAKPSNSIFSGGNSTNIQQNTSTFGNQQLQSNVFSSSNQHTVTSATSGLFSQQNQFLQQQQQNSNIFRQAAQNSQPPQGLFAQAAQTMQQQQTHPPQGVFAQTPQQTSATQGIFPQQTQNIFGQQQANQNVFQQHLPQQQQQTNSNIFQQNQSIAPQQQIQHQQQPSGIFQQAAQQIQNPVMQTNQFSQANPILYSRIEDLSPDEIDAFKADFFLPGKIPFNPPPRELIN